MKIAYLLKKFPRLSETFVLGEILRQQERGTDLHIFSRRTPDDEPRHGMMDQLQVPIELLPNPREIDPWRALFLRHHRGEELWVRLGEVLRPFLAEEFPGLDRLVAEALHVLQRCEDLHIDHLHVHFATDSAIVAHLVRGLGGPTYSITAHAKDIYRSTIGSRRLSLLVEQSAFVVTVCDANVEYLSRFLTTEAALRVRRLYNGIDLKEFRFATGNRDSLHVLAVGRLVEKKGFDLLVRACASMTEEYPNLRVSILGEGEQRAELEALVRELGLQNHVELLGARPQEWVRQAMTEATVLCLPCRVGDDGNRDALPTVLLEALAVGLPCISTPVTGIPEILDQGNCGVLVPEDDVPSIQAALRRLLSDPELRREIALQGRLHAQELFDGYQAAETLNRWWMAFEPEGIAQ